MLQLIFTSTPKGLLQGRSGFSTVAMTQGFPNHLVPAVENLSAYERLYSAENENERRNPVNYRYMRQCLGNQNWAVLSKIESNGPGYSGRGSSIASHVLLTDGELEHLGGTPAQVLACEDNFRWSGEVEYLPTERRLLCPPPLASDNRFSERLFHRPEMAKIIGECFRRHRDKPYFLVFDPLKFSGQDILGFIGEVSRTLTPEEQRELTFSTYCHQTSLGNAMFIRAYPSNSPFLGSIKRFFGDFLLYLGETPNLSSELEKIRTEILNAETQTSQATQSSSTATESAEPIRQQPPECPQAESQTAILRNEPCCDAGSQQNISRQRTPDAMGTTPSLSLIHERTPIQPRIRPQDDIPSSKPSWRRMLLFVGLAVAFVVAALFLVYLSMDSGKGAVPENARPNTVAAAAPKPTEKPKASLPTKSPGPQDKPRDEKLLETMARQAETTETKDNKDAETPKTPTSGENAAPPTQERQEEGAADKTPATETPDKAKEGGAASNQTDVAPPPQDIETQMRAYVQAVTKKERTAPPAGWQGYVKQHLGKIRTERVPRRKNDLKVVYEVPQHVQACLDSNLLKSVTVEVYGRKICSAPKGLNSTPIRNGKLEVKVTELLEALDGFAKEYRKKLKKNEEKVDELLKQLKKRADVDLKKIEDRFVGKEGKWNKFVEANKPLKAFLEKHKAFAEKVKSLGEKDTKAKIQSLEKYHTEFESHQKACMAFKSSDFDGRNTAIGFLNAVVGTGKDDGTDEEDDNAKGGTSWTKLNKSAQNVLKDVADRQMKDLKELEKLSRTKFPKLYDRLRKIVEDYGALEWKGVPEDCFEEGCIKVEVNDMGSGK